MNKSRRSRIEIIGQILQAATCNSEGLTKTQLVYRTNTTFVRTRQLLSFLIEQGLLQRSENNGLHLYKTTTQGSELAKAIEKVLGILGSKDFDFDGSDDPNKLITIWTKS